MDTEWIVDISLDEARKLLEEGMDPDSRSGDGEYQLLNCIFYGRWDLVELLLEYGANPNVTTKGDKRSALGLVMMICYSRMEGPSPNIVKAVNLLLKHGANPNIENKHGITPIYNTRHKEITLPLLDHGADPFYTNSNMKWRNWPKELAFKLDTYFYTESEKKYLYEILSLFTSAPSLKQIILRKLTLATRELDAI